MKLISTLYLTEKLDFTINIQPRTSRNDQQKADGPLVTRYRSKIGNESLIFNPHIALIVRSREIRAEAPNAIIPLNLFYRFTAALSSVYQNLQTDKLFIISEGVMYIDKKVALTVSRKIPLFRNTLVIAPAACTDRTGKPIKGVEFTVDGKSMGSMDHIDTLGVIDVLDHLDVSTFSLMSGMIDQMDTFDRKTDVIIEKLDKIESSILQTTQPQQEAPVGARGPFRWTALD